jgi:hypothetical protein
METMLKRNSSLLDISSDGSTTRYTQDLASPLAQVLNDGTHTYTYDPLNRLIPCSPDHFLNAEAQRRRGAERQRGKQGQSVFICVHLW